MTSEGVFSMVQAQPTNEVHGVYESREITDDEVQSAVRESLDQVLVHVRPPRSRR